MKHEFFINGRKESSSETQAVNNPWSGEEIAQVYVADAAQVEEAVAGAAKAFAEARKMPAWERAQKLHRVADGIANRKQEFVDTLIAEAGKPVTFAEGEVQRAESTFRFAAHLATEDEGQGIKMDGSPAGMGHFGFVQRFPMGVILGITPFNFPLNLVAHKVAPCLATGNTMVLKPALKTPLSALLLAEVVEAAGFPAGQLNTVPFGHEHLDPLLDDARIKMLSFTGSAGVGWKLKGRAAKMKCALELGGNAAVIVEPEEGWESAVSKIASAAYGYAGQSCISVQRILVQEGIYEKFREAFVTYIREKCLAGDPSKRETVVGPMINADARDKIVQWVKDAEAAGGSLLLPLRTEGRSVLHPVVLENVPAGCAAVSEEAFAPLAVLQKYGTFDEALSIANDSAYGLQAGVFTTDMRKAFKAFETLEVGGVMINQVPTFRVENMPYGGLKESGFGREGVCYAMEEMTEPRSLVINRQ